MTVDLHTTNNSTTKAINNTHTATDARQLGTKLFEDWTGMWNGDLDIADRILTPGFRVHFGNVIPDVDTDGLRGPADLVPFITAHRKAKPGLVYRMHGVALVDIDAAADGGPAGQVGCRWSATRPDPDGAGVITVSGVDILAVAGGRITDVWSVTGSRRFGTDV
ncbi:nuclear transport factor 2 family protein [Streptomyces sp. H10-C2]|uniref:nuclear transport factor 2 family protein n=1 Tax=unclassified Streptomyces TaxID=2593676 RepID=UPI0024BAD2F1|nr:MULTISPECIES: nuclear transport factor 2 family protein [unclassified Streptomyces]MDJ0346041.1 nuclear transport factor 2 family protein [Streptomyces sp. PH10-H1]MDJ0372969.1 nuclear transport factor 2 family protein [Streptomyces sp. H10-C2]